MKILFLDIETTPHLVYTWGLFRQNIGVNQIVEPSRVMCFAARWLDGPMQFYSEWGDGRPHMLATAHELLGLADVVVHYNGASFDVPHLNREFLETGLEPPAPFVQLDLLSAVRRNFQFASNKLVHVVSRLDAVGAKLGTDFGLWPKCMGGDVVAQKKMERYNRRDVKLLVDLYRELLPWLSNHPNRQLYDNDGGVDPAAGCTACGSPRVWSHGWAYTKMSRYQRLQCADCGTYMRTCKRDLSVTIQGVVR